MVRTPTKLAHQLTHVELERLSHIGAEEFVLAFMKERGVSTTADDGSGAPIKKTRSKEAYEDWFTRLSYLVATEICKVSKRKVSIYFFYDFHLSFCTYPLGLSSSVPTDEDATCVRWLFPRQRAAGPEWLSSRSPCPAGF